MFLKVSNVSAWHPTSPEKYLLNCPIRKPRKPSKLCLQLAWFSNCLEKNGILCEYFQWDGEVQVNTVVFIYQQKLGDDTVTNNPQILVVLNKESFILAHVYCELSWGERRDPFYYFTLGLLLTKLAISSHPMVVPKERAPGGRRCVSNISKLMFQPQKGIWWATHNLFVRTDHVISSNHLRARKCHSAMGLEDGELEIFGEQRKITPASYYWTLNVFQRKFTFNIELGSVENLHTTPLPLCTVFVSCTHQDGLLCLAREDLATAVEG